MILCIIVFFGASIWALVYTLRQEERKLELLQKQNEIDTYSPAALRDLRRWIEETPIDSDPDVQLALEAYDKCVETLRESEHHFYGWSEDDIMTHKPLAN